MPKRAANNMGTIRKRSDGRWEGRYTAPDGKQHSVYAQTQAACTAELRAAQTDVDGGAWVEPSKLTVEEWLDIWMKDYQGDNSELTILKYKSIAKNNFKPTIGNVKLLKLSPMHIRRFLSAMKDKGLSQITIANYLRILKTALNAAVEAKLIKESPAANITVSRGKVKAFHVVDKSMFSAFIKSANETKYGNELAFLLYTGLRVGELRGLQWSDADLKNETLTVKRQLHNKSQTTKRITTPKYDEERTIYLPKAAVAVLKAQRIKQNEQRLAAGEKWVDNDVCHDLIFRMETGVEHGEKTIADAVRYVGSAIGIPDLHPHDLRHSYAVAALRSGTDVKTVQHNLGHKTASMTLDVYVKYTEDAGRDAAQKLSDYFSN